MAQCINQLPKKVLHNGAISYIDGIILYEDSLGISGAQCCQEIDNWTSMGEYRTLASTEFWYKRGMRFHKPCYCKVCKKRVNGFEVMPIDNSILRCILRR